MTYVVEKPAQPTDAGDAKGQVGLSWPKLKVHFGLKSAEHATPDVEGKDETVTYAVQHIEPVPGEGDHKKLGGGIEWPKFRWHFGGKAPGKVDVEHQGEPETVTYIVESPVPSEEVQVKSGFSFSVPKPKIDLRFKKKPEKHEEIGRAHV